MALHALDIPEIATLIVTQLTRRQLCKCLLVSRHWHDAFAPFIWDHTLLEKVYFSNYPTPGGLQRYSHLIFKLSYCDLPLTPVTLGYFQVNFPHLISFRGHYLPRSQWKNSERYYWGERDPLLGFLERLDPKPLSLTLDSHFDELKDESEEDLKHSIWRVVMVGCKAVEVETGKSVEYGSPPGPIQSLHSLTLNRVTFHWREMDACEGIWDVLRNLNSLTIQIWSHSRVEWPLPARKTLTAGASEMVATTTGQDFKHPFEKMAGAKIQHLKLVYCEHGDPTFRSEFELVRQCRDLRSLVWINPASTAENVNLTPAFTLEFQARRWPLLESLNLSIPCLHDKQLETIIESTVRPLRELTVEGSSFGVLASEALLRSGGGRHSKSLEVLRISKARHANGDFLQKVLCSFPNLLTLHGWAITDLDIWRNPEPWVCHRLKDFRVTLCFEMAVRVPVGSLFSWVKDSRRTSTLPNLNIPPRPLEMVNDEDTVAVFFDRLAKCTELETLLIGQREYLAKTDWRGAPLSTSLTYQPLELGCGLDQLKTLWRLRHLDMRATNMNMTMLEVDWMLEQWPNLEKFWADHLSRDHDLGREIWSKLQERGIQKTWQFE